MINFTGSIYLMKIKPEIPHCDFCNVCKKSIFHDLSDDAIAELNENKKCNFYTKGQLIFNEGNRINGIYCINKGKVKLFQVGSEGKNQIIKFAKEGEIIGYRALLSDEPLSASAAAIEDATLCFIPKAHFFKIITDHPNFNFKMLKLLSHELGDATKVITDLAQKSVRERVAEVLLILKETFDLDDEKTLQVQLSREELANIVGTASESVIRLLSEFKKDGMIDLKGKNIMLLDIPKLTKTANIFD